MQTSTESSPIQKWMRSLAGRLWGKIASRTASQVHIPYTAEAAREYLRACRESVKQSTCSTYETVIEKHILPEFGETPISELTAEEINSFLREKVFPSEGEALSASTARSIVTAMRGILQTAADAGCECPSPESIRRPSRSGFEAKVLSTAEQERLKEYCCRDTDPAKLGVLISLMSGLRIGEVCALKWGDISAASGTLTVRRTVQRIRNPEYTGGSGEHKTVVIFDEPKSKSANRCIPLPMILLDRSKLLRRPDDCFLLTGSAQSWMEPRTLQRRFKRMLAEAEVCDMNFHGLRHTFATNWVEQDFDVKTLSKILGHSDISVTLNTYVHPSISSMRSYMERMA